MIRKRISHWRQKFYEWLYAMSAKRCRRYHLDQHPRKWSNAQLRKLAPLFQGEVVNVSAYKDIDKENGHYRNYFTAASHYSLTNYWGSNCPNDGHPDALFLDLDAPLPESMKQRFDVVFNHTVLEHVFGIEQAVKNLCEMSRDVVVTVVPFMQQEHYSSGLYGDFWRFTPLGLKQLMQQNGFEVVYLSANDTSLYPIYIVMVASSRPDFWKARLPEGFSSDNRIGSRLFHLAD